VGPLVQVVESVMNMYIYDRGYIT